MRLKELFVNYSEHEIETLFTNDEACLKFLADAKWENGYACRKCGHNNYCHGKTPHSRRCTKCKHDESATANTPFHGCRIPLSLAFSMAYNICCQPEISTYKLSDIHNTRQMTCWKLKKKILECIEIQSTAKVHINPLLYS